MNEFFAYMARLKLIRRWSLMRNTAPENDAEHSLQVAMIAHGLALLGQTRYQRGVDAEHVAVLAVYHDAAEVLTGDLPTPVKYHSEGLRDAYRQVEEAATSRLCGMLPPDIRAGMLPVLTEQDTLAARYVKAADRLSALIKCMEEEKAGNREFAGARAGVYARLTEMQLPEVEIFIQEFLPAYELTLDDLKVRDE